MQSKPLFLALSVLAGGASAKAQELKRTEFVGTYRSFSQTDVSLYGNDSLPEFTRTVCHGMYQLALLDRRSLGGLVNGDPDSLFPYAREGGKARVVTGTDICNDSTLGRGGVAGSAKVDTDAIIGVLAYDDYEPSRSASRLEMVLDITPVDTFVTRPRFREGLDGSMYRENHTTRRRLGRQSDGALRGEGTCESLGGMVTTDRGFGPRKECHITVSLALPADSGLPPGRGAAAEAGDSIASLAVHFWETLDTLLWGKATPQAGVLRRYLAVAPFPRSYKELEFQTLLRSLESFSVGDQTVREMLGSYRPSSDTKLQRVEEAKASRARLRSLAASSGHP